LASPPSLQGSPHTFSSSGSSFLTPRSLAAKTNLFVFLGPAGRLSGRELLLDFFFCPPPLSAIGNDVCFGEPRAAVLAELFLEFFLSSVPVPLFRGPRAWPT